MATACAPAVIRKENLDHLEHQIARAYQKQELRNERQKIDKHLDDLNFRESFIIACAALLIEHRLLRRLLRHTWNACFPTPETDERPTLTQLLKSAEE